MLSLIELSLAIWQGKQEKTVLARKLARAASVAYKNATEEEEVVKTSSEKAEIVKTSAKKEVKRDRTKNRPTPKRPPKRRLSESTRLFLRLVHDRVAHMSHPVLYVRVRGKVRAFRVQEVAAAMSAAAVRRNLAMPELVRFLNLLRSMLGAAARLSAAKTQSAKNKWAGYLAYYMKGAQKMAS